MQLDQARIEDAIVREVADKIIGEDGLWQRVKNAVDKRIDDHFKKTADAQIQTQIESAVIKGFEHEYCRVNSFGQRVSEKTTIKAELDRMIGGYWNVMVGKDGKETSSSHGAVTRAEWLMAQLVAADFEGEMKQHVVNIGGALKDKLRTELHTTVNKLLSEVIRVNSFEDQELKNNDRACIDPKQKKDEV